MSMRYGKNTKVYHKHIDKKNDDYWNRNLHEENEKYNKKYSNKKSDSDLNNQNYMENGFSDEELSQSILNDLANDDSEKFTSNSDNSNYKNADDYREYANSDYANSNVGGHDSYSESEKYYENEGNDFKPIFFNDDRVKDNENQDNPAKNRESYNSYNINYDELKKIRENESSLNLIDLRIIVNNSRNADYLNKICGNIDFSQYNINLSAIIQTNDINIAKITTFGSDIIIIAENDDKTLFNQFYNEIKTDDNYIEHLGILDNNVNLKYLESKLNKLIIKIGLSSLINVNHLNSLKQELSQNKKELSDLNEEIQKLSSENRELNNENSKLWEDNNNLNLEITNLQKVNDELKSEFADFKTRYSNIHTKKILEIFSLSGLWNSTFNEEFTEEEKVIIATNQFKPENIIVGQGFIGARSVDEAIDWLKVVKTALVILDYDNKGNLKFSNQNSNNDNSLSHENNYEIPDNINNFL